MMLDLYNVCEIELHTKPYRSSSTVVVMIPNYTLYDTESYLDQNMVSSSVTDMIYGIQYWNVYAYLSVWI